MTTGIPQKPEDHATMGVTILEEVDSYSYGNRFEVTACRVRLPNGSETTFYIRKGQQFAIVIPVCEDGSFVMIKQYRLGAEQITLEFPMGEVAGKSATEAAPIELKEETGYTASSIEQIGSFHISPGWSTQEGQIFLATGLTEGNANPEEFEFVTPVTVTQDELEQMIDTGAIIDASTRVAYETYRRFQQKNAAGSQLT